MAQDIPLAPDTWTDLTAAFAIPVAQAAKLQNTGSAVVRVETSNIEPAQKDQGLALPAFEIANAAPAAGESIWAIAIGKSTGKVQQLVTVNP